MKIDEEGVLSEVEDSDIKDGTFKIPANVRYIDKLAFHGCIDLKYLKIPEGVISIGEYAFRSCIRLRIVEIPSSVIGIRASSFSIPDTRLQQNPLRKVIITPDRKLTDKFKSCFPPHVIFVVKENEKTVTPNSREK